jgi:hypothetical protein
LTSPSPLPGSGWIPVLEQDQNADSAVWRNKISAGCGRSSRVRRFIGRPVPSHAARQVRSAATCPRSASCAAWPMDKILRASPAVPSVTGIVTGGPALPCFGWPWRKTESHIPLALIILLIYSKRQKALGGYKPPRDDRVRVRFPKPQVRCSSHPRGKACCPRTDGRAATRSYRFLLALRLHHRSRHRSQGKHA